MARKRLFRVVFALVGCLSLTAGCDEKSGAEATPKASASAAVTDVNLAGVDTSTLTPREKREWSAEVSELLAPCPDTPVSIAQCVKENRACKTCKPAAELLLQQVQAGRSKKDREDAFHARFDKDKVKNIPLDGDPSVGPDDAPETLVEWADFECPFCKMMAPILDDVVHHFPGQVRLVYRFYPLQAHPHGEIAARAAIAAQNQGKFWEMHHLLFENQEHLEPQDLEQYAKSLHLDVAKWKADLVSKETGERIDKDKKVADDLGLDGTPFLFANGRYVDLHLLVNPYTDLLDWVKLDIQLAGKTPNVAPSGSAAAGAPPAPSGSASAEPAASASAAAGAPHKPKKK
ncbi:MAG TPA: thioredoxin domain-containing protein [Minicystis sp.]|nr:thioredoxin domain-containing protein [Minicystis sp.]